MNIGLVRRGFSRTGGAESYLKRLGQVLADHGHAITLYASADWPPAEWPFGKLVHLEGCSPLQFAQELADRTTAGELLFSLERILKCDCYRAGDGVHQSWLERRSELEPGWRSRFRRATRKHKEVLFLEREMLQNRRTRFVIANSKLVKEEIIKEYGFPAEQIAVVYNGLPHSQFQNQSSRRAELRNQFGLKQTDVGLLFAGSGWTRKGLRFALEAMRRTKNRNLKLLVAGRGRKPLLVNEKVCFLGPLSDVGGVCLASDLFVLPTIYDPFSNACLEALSFGLPVITTAANGFSEIIKPGVHGQIIQRPDDVAALADALNVWSDANLRTKARPACVELSAAYSMERNMNETVEQLEKLGAL
jgi:UDP-glucose:(heptosyl)LPS alpha-1,3-glucosyltransferase